MHFIPTQVQSQQNIDFIEYDLKNELHVILYKDNSKPIVSVDIWYHVGSKDEDPDRTGFAHLFEHMMFQGSQNVGKTEHFKYIHEAGGTLNGSTNQDRTNYYETVPSNQLELVLWLESDRMGTLEVTQENFDNQREVVKEEKRQRYDNVPYGSRFYNLFKNAYSGHPYSWIPIGSVADLNIADLAYAQGFYKKYYAPDNAVLVIAGDIDYNETKKLIDKYFKGIKPSTFKKNNYPQDKLFRGEIKDTVFDNVQLPAVYTAYKIPPVTSTDIYPLTLLSMILADGKSSRLYKSLVYQNKKAKSVNSFIWGLELGGLFIISAMGMKDSSPDEIENLINEEIENIQIGNLSQIELEKVKNSVETDFINRLQTLLFTADMLAFYWSYFRNTNLINTDLENYVKVTVDDIRNAAKKYLAPNNRVTMYYLPKNKLYGSSKE
jgi:predicted Zn-dependent peptidase